MLTIATFVLFGTPPVLPEPSSILILVTGAIAALLYGGWRRFRA
jgi:hypothetical protein